MSSSNVLANRAGHDDREHRMKENFSQGISRRGFIKGIGASAAAVVMAGLVGCGGGSGSGTDAKTTAASGKAASGASGGSHKLEMVTDTGGVNDQSFNQLSWEGLQELNSKTGWDVNYLESKQESDYATNLDKAVDDNSSLIWGIGFAMADAITTSATANPDVQFAIIDNANPSGNANLTGVQFRAQEPSFMVGYIAARFSKTAKVGFVGGISSDVIDQFEFGYKAGVVYANATKKTNVEVQAQYAESFSDSAKGKSIAAKMFSDGCDIVFHAAGGVGTGVIEAAKDAGKYAIGVDKDQAYLAEKNVITSALKRVDVAVVDVSTRLLSGDLKGGTTISLGMNEDCVGIPEKHDIIGDEIYNEALEVGKKIKDSSVKPPANKSEFDSFKA